jgi:hypothetical protein
VKLPELTLIWLENSSKKENDMNESTLVPREEMSDLDWLARNVHEWPEGKREVLVRWPRNVDTLIWSYVLSDTGWITKDQWLASRAELQKKPGWKDHPDAKCFVQNSCGHWWKNTETGKVEPSGEYWRVHDSVVLRRASTVWVELNKGELLGDWRNTLEKRPEQAKFEPFVSVEDAATAKQPDPKGSGNPILGMVLTDLTNRALEGKEKYGEPLLANNGRNPLWDAYQEALDLAMYLRQAIEEQK